MGDTGTLTVNLSAISQNWLMICKALHSGAACAAVVKANAYGLGVARVAQALYAAGCRTFFVAQLAEGVELRRIIPQQVPIFVLQGALAGEEPQFTKHGLTPVIISLPMLERWQAFCNRQPAPPECAIKLNTGMNRLGLGLDEYYAWLDSAERRGGVHPQLLLSHLACADEPDNPLNQVQLNRFDEALTALRKYYPQARGSLANSAGVFLGSAFHYDLVRPGIALYGGAPRLDRQVQPQAVVTVVARVIQTRRLDAGEAVGYGAEFRAPQTMQVAVVAGGYAEGLMRSLRGSYKAWFHEPLPLLGRVSMDSLVFDITHLPELRRPVEGDGIELLGPHVSLDDFARCAGTSSYEVLTRLGGRLHKRYAEPGL